MASQLQIDANRRNSQKSTGPKTPEGRAAVRLNGVKHGLTANILVLPGEDESAFTALLDSLEAEHAPATPTEEILVRHLAMASWRLQRLYHLEASAFTLGRTKINNKIYQDEHFKSLNDSGQFAYVALEDPFGAKPLANFAIYEARLERSFYKALHELQRIRALRQKETKNQTQSVPVGQVPDLPDLESRNQNESAAPLAAQPRAAHAGAGAPESADTANRRVSEGGDRQYSASRGPAAA